MKNRILALLLTLALVLPAVSCDVLLADPGTPSTPSDKQEQNSPTNHSAEAETKAPSSPETNRPDTTPDRSEEPQTETREPDREPEVATAEPETMVAPQIPTEPETTVDPETTAEPETEEPLPFVEPYEAGLISVSFDTFYVNGRMYFEQDGNAGEKLDAMDNRICFLTGEPCKFMRLRGWIGFGQEIQSFGYYIDSYDFIYDDVFMCETETPVKQAGGEYASRFEIQVPLTQLEAGEHRVGFVVMLMDGTVVRMRNEIMVGIEKLNWQDSGSITHLSFDELDLWMDDMEFADVFIPGQSADWNGIADCDPEADVLRYRGWIGLTSNVIGRFGYSINGGKAIFDDSFTADTEDMVINTATSITGAVTATRMGVYIPLVGLYGEGNTVAVLYQDDLGNTMILTEFTLNISDASADDPEDSTEDPEDPVDPETPVDPDAPVDPMQPVNIFFASDIDYLTMGMGISDATVVGNSFLHIVPFNSDPSYYPFSKVTGARYIAIRYRTADALNAYIQCYIASRGSTPFDDTSMLQQPVVVDGEWHLAIFDTQSLTEAGIYDGEYVSYFRFDPLEAGYKLDENGLPYKPDGMNYARYELPDGCSIDVSYIGFFNSAEAALKYDTENFGSEYTPAPEEPEQPSFNNAVIDMATLSGPGFRSSFPAAGYSDLLQILGYAMTIDLGNIDLSQYSAVKITYGCDGSPVTEERFAKASSLAIGLKNENSSYGQENDDNFNGDIAHADMVFSEMNWASGARDAVIDLTNVDYNGNVWVAVHNPQGTEIAISAIEFVPY